jgi:glycosyltransferase involved in cell wall biosynthesis
MPQNQAPEVDVTVVVPTRNRPALLQQALDSIGQQTGANYEVVIVDDGSTEDRAAEYRTLAGRYGSRVRLLQPMKPGEMGSGPSLSRNRGIAAGMGRYFAFLDDDDTWIWDEHLKTAVEVLDSSKAELYCADMQGFRDGHLEIETWFPDRTPMVSGTALKTNPAVYRLSRRGFVEASRHRNLNPDPIVVSRALLDRAGGYLVTLRFAEDYEFLMRLVNRTDSVLFCDKTVARYRLPESDSHSESMSRIEQHLQSLAAAQHLRMTAHSPEVRQAARKLESWTLRSISTALRANGQTADALVLAFQALLVRPTLGSVWHVGRTVFSNGSQPS